jgi:hypothetical protein
VSWILISGGENVRHLLNRFTPTENAFLALINDWDSAFASDEMGYDMSWLMKYLLPGELDGWKLNQY